VGGVGAFILSPTSSFYEQFETETVVERELTLSEEVLAEKYKDRLESSYRVI